MNATSSNLDMFWTVTAIVAIGVFLTRFSFFWLMDRITVTPTLRRVLAYIPAAVLPAIVMPAVIYQGPSAGLDLANLRIYAALLAILVAWKTRNLFATIGAGMVALWILRWYF